MDRRTILKSIGIGSTGISMMGAATASSDTYFNPGKFENIVVKDKETDSKIINKIESERDSKELLRSIRKKGWKIDWGDATIRRVIDKAEDYEYDYVVASATKRNNRPNKNDELVFFWFGNSTTDLDLDHHTFAHHVWTDDSVNIQSTNTLFGYDQGKAFLPVEDGITEQKIKMETSNEVSTQSNNNLDPGGGGGGGDIDCCEMDIMLVEGMDWECFAVAIASLVGTVVSCGGCAVTMNPGACIACALAAGLTLAAFKHCRESWTDGVHVVETVNKSWFDEYESRCTDYWTTNDDKAVMTFDYYESEFTDSLCNL